MWQMRREYTIPYMLCNYHLLHFSTQNVARYFTEGKREREGGGRKGKENKKKKRVGHRDRRSKAEKGK